MYSLTGQIERVNEDLLFELKSCWGGGGGPLRTTALRSGVVNPRSTRGQGIMTFRCLKSEKRGETYEII